MTNKIRRVPRREFYANVGVLHLGVYEIGRASQLGEGGMMFSTEQRLEEGQLIVATFYIQSQNLVIVRGVVRSIVPSQGKQPIRFGIEFQNLEFTARREIRNFVAEATRSEGPEIA